MFVIYSSLIGHCQYHFLIIKPGPHYFCEKILTERDSSTSLDVCELWNGVGVVRVVGKADILEFIYDEGSIYQSSQVKALPLEIALITNWVCRYHSASC